jgi:hypothetical protein
MWVVSWLIEQLFASQVLCSMELIMNPKAHREQTNSPSTGQFHVSADLLQGKYSQYSLNMSLGGPRAVLVHGCKQKSSYPCRESNSIHATRCQSVHRVSNSRNAHNSVTSLIISEFPRTIKMGWLWVSALPLDLVYEKNYILSSECWNRGIEYGPGHRWLGVRFTITYPIILLIKIIGFCHELPLPIQRLRMSMEEHEFQLFQSKALRKIFLAKRDEVDPSVKFRILGFITKIVKWRRYDELVT